MNFYNKEGETMSYISLGGFGGGATFLGPTATPELFDKVTGNTIEVDGEEITKQELWRRQMKSARSNPGYFDPVALTVGADSYQKLADTMRNIPKGRDVLPLPYYDNVQFENRNSIVDITSYTRIGDTVLMIPPTFIGVFNDGKIEEISNIRQNGTTKVNQGFNQRTVIMTLFFCGANQINGYKVESPHGSKKFYVDGLRSLLAQFHSTPFLPIQNILLNATYGIYTVALSHIEVQTVEGFPDCLEATLTLTEFNSSIYTEIPDAFFDSLIDWDLFRYGYQRHLNSIDSPRYMPPIKINSGEHKFKISLIDQEIFNDNNSQILSGMSINKMFETFLTHEDDLILTRVTFGLSNTLAEATMPSHSSPALQYMGGTDARVQVVFETRNQQSVSVMEQVIERFRSLSRQFKDYNHFGFLRFENEYIQLTGTEFFVIDQVESTTVPEFPGLFKISMSLIGFDIRQESHENLKGMRPFNRKGTKSDAITQDAKGVLNRIQQDNYIERQMMDKFELYPDLNLPTYKEINEAITNINNYRRRKGLSKLPYSKYPELPSIIPGQTMDGTYTKFLDPDFYVMYPLSFSDLNKAYIDKLKDHKSSKPTKQVIPDLDYGERYVQDKRNAYLVEEGYVDLSGQLNSGTNHYNDIYGNITTGGGTALNANAQTYVKLLKEQVGKNYVWGATGQYYNGVQSWDCSGFVCWGLWQMGLWKDSKGQGMRFVTANFNGGEKPGYWRYINYLELKPGDLCLVSGHVGVYIGTDEKGVPRTVEAMNPSKGICIGWVKDSNKWYYDKFARITAFEGNTGRSITVNNYTNYAHPPLEREVYLDENGNAVVNQDTVPSYQASIRMDMKFDSRVTAAILDNYLKKGLAGYGQMIVKHSKQWNVDPALVSAVAIFETGWGTSNLFVNYNNPGGISGKGAPRGFQAYATREDGIAALASLLGRKYVKLGTIEEMGKVYCPTSDPRDTAGTNSSWATNVKRFFLAIKELAYGQSASSIESAYQNGGGKFTSTNPSFQAGFLDNLNFSGYTKTPVDVPFGYEEVECKDDDFKQDDAGKDVNCKCSNCKEIEKMGEPYVQVSPFVQTIIKDKASLDDNKKIFNSTIKKYAENSNKTTDVGMTGSVSSSNSGTVSSTGSVASENPVSLGDISSAYTKTKLKKWGIYDSYENINTSKNLGGLFIERMCKEKILHYMCVDMKKFSAKGRLLRAFPTFVFMIVDDGGEWLDGRKLWSNYYLYRSIMSIQVFQEESQPVHTATILINDAFDKLTTSPRYPMELYKKTFVENDSELFSSKAWYNFKYQWYKWTGSLLGGPKLTQNLVDLKNYLHESIKIKPGCRIHIRMGYGSNPLQLPIVFNGVVAELEQEDGIVQIVAQSDGAQLIQRHVSSKEDDKNSFMYLQSEPSNIIASLLTERDNKISNFFNKKWGEPNRFGIENFGVNIRSIANQEGQHDLLNNVYIGKYKPMHFSDWRLLNADGEENFNTNLYGRYPWDIMQMCAQFLPEFVCQPVYHQFESRVFYGLPYLPYRYRYDWMDQNDYGSIFESAKIFTQYHFVDSTTDIIANKIKASSRGLKTNMVGLYKLGSGSHTTPTLYSDRTIDWSKQSTGLLDTNSVQDYFGPDLLWRYTFWDIGRPAAIKIAISNMLDQWNKTYRGELIILGDSSIKPCDYVHLSDSYHDMNGTFRVRQVIHSISGDRGFTTSITPGLIAVSATQNSGSINLLKGLTSFSIAIQLNSTARFLLLQSMKHFGNALHSSTVIDWILKRSVTQSAGAASRTLWNAFKTGSLITDYAGTLSKVKQSYKTVETIDDFYDAVNGIKLGVRTGNTIKDIALTAQASISTVAGTVVPVVGHIVAWLATEILLNSVLDWVFDQFQWNNCVKVLPLTYKGSSFVVNAKGAKNLLLVDANAIENSSFETDEDKNASEEIYTDRVFADGESDEIEVK